MVAVFANARKPLVHLFALLSGAMLAACTTTLATDADVGRQINPQAPIDVALLVPGGSSIDTDNLLARNFENAARLAMADLQGAEVNLRVYQTAGGNPQQAANAAVQAVSDGAKIIIGPLYGEAANAAGVATAGRNINVLAFSNNPAFAGGNVFILGPTFANTADRLVQFGRNRGITRYMILHGDDLPGRVGRDAIAGAVQANGAEIASIESYPLSQQGIFSATRSIVTTANQSGPQAIFTTAGANADLPIIATALPDAGLDTGRARFVGLTRWDTVPQLTDLPGLEGGLFALPDPGPAELFANRYAAAYGEQPHPLASLAYDGIAAIGALAAAGNRDALTKSALTQPQGFRGTSGVFRLMADGMNQRGLAVATIQNNQITLLEQAPRSFAMPGF